MDAWDALNAQIVDCAQCARLRDYCNRVAHQRRRAFQEWNYWGRPVPNFGDVKAQLLIVGLAPAAHGANRTGRMFTGDRSGEWLYRALYRAGFASQPTATHADDGLHLHNCAITAVGHCAPPDNRPTPDEMKNCRIWFTSTIDLVPARVFLALGQIAWQAMLQEAKRRNWFRGPRPRFQHGAAIDLDEDRCLLASYHPSQQNTFTGRLTQQMLDDVMQMARARLKSASPGARRKLSR